MLEKNQVEYYIQKHNDRTIAVKYIDGVRRIFMYDEYRAYRDSDLNISRVYTFNNKTYIEFVTDENRLTQIHIHDHQYHPGIVLT